MTPKANPTERVVSNAILVRCSQSAWTARVKDKVVSARTNQQYGAENGTASVWKRLFGPKCEELTALMAAYTNIRNVHNAESMPWTEDGWRIVPTANYFVYMEKMRAAIKAFYKARDVFVRALDRLVDQAEKTTGAFFDRKEFPRAEDVVNKYGVSMDYRTIPVGSDFRVNLPDNVLKEIGEQVESRVSDALRDATQDLWQRLGEAVQHMRDRFDEGNRLQDPMVQTLRELTDTLTRLNVTGDAALEKIRQRVQEELTHIDVNGFRGDGNKGARKEVVAIADDILAQMKANYAPVEKKKANYAPVEKKKGEK